MRATLQRHLVDVSKFQKRKDKEPRMGERKGNLFKDRVLNRVFHADPVGALNILRVGTKLLKLGFYNNFKMLSRSFAIL